MDGRRQTSEVSFISLNITMHCFFAFIQISYYIGNWFLVQNYLMQLQIFQEIRD